METIYTNKFVWHEFAEGQDAFHVSNDLETLTNHLLPGRPVEFLENVMIQISENHLFIAGFVREYVKTQSAKSRFNYWLDEQNLALFNVIPNESNTIFEKKHWYSKRKSQKFINDLVLPFYRTDYFELKTSNWALLNMNNQKFL
jgi:hypothetical protein